MRAQTLLLLILAAATWASPARPTAAGGAERKRDPGTGIFINQKELTRAQVDELVRIYRYPPPKGRFWYDARSGLYGQWGQAAAGYIRAGHPFAPLPANASAGNTGVFINGRELNAAEVAFLQVLYDGQVRRGRAWLDAQWNLGIEGSPYPLTNLAAAIRQHQQRGRGGRDWSWRDGSGAAMSSDGNCTMMAVPGAPVYGTSGCN